jgi:hypothetical protein
MHRRPIATILLAAVLAAGCGLLGDLARPGEATYPEACAVWSFPERQCRSIVFRASQAAGVDLEDVRTTRFLPFEREMTLGGGQIALVAFDLADGTSVEQEVVCAGISMGPVCNAEPVILVSTGIDRDVPCAGEAPEGCATLRPSPPPDVLARGVPLEVDALDIPIDHLGDYRVEVGKALLPDGYLRERSARLVETVPDDYWLGHVALVVESDIPDRDPAGNIYREPYDGPEPMTVWLVFDVTELFKPSIVQVRDIVVR